MSDDSKDEGAHKRWLESEEEPICGSEPTWEGWVVKGGRILLQYPLFWPEHLTEASIVVEGNEDFPGKDGYCE